MVVLDESLDVLPDAGLPGVEPIQDEAEGGSFVHPCQASE